MRQLVLRATTLISEASDPAEQQQRQEELERVVNSPDAWGLITPFLEYDSDPNVQFYGAHILGVKIARAWNTLDTSIHFPLRDSILELTGRAIALQRPKMVLRRLYIAITAIALKLTTASPPQWSDFLTSSLLALQSQGANKEALLEFMTIAVEEVHRAPKGSNNHIADAVNAAIPSFMDTFTSTVLSSTSKETENLLALKCLQSWIGWGLSGNDITTVVPTLISILSTPPLFIATSDALQDILIASAMADGAGIKTITEPLLDWIFVTGRTIADSAVVEGTPNPISSSLCRLLCALGDHSNLYIAKKLINASQAGGIGNATTSGGIEPRIQEFLRLMLLYTGFPGFFGTDEEDSESTLGFWYLLQESLWEVGEEEDETNEWADLINNESLKAVQNVIENAIDGVNNVDYMMDESGPMKSPINGESQPEKVEADSRMKMAKILFGEVVTILRRKVMWPTSAQMQESGGWDAEQRENFTVYRRNVGDTLINACYVLRDQFLTSLLEEMKVQLAQASQQPDIWESIEAILFSIKAVHDALTSSNLEPLEFLFHDSA
ncbi:hypothetical protein FRC18_004285, partial [Serendipita sp. 400]